MAGLTDLRHSPADVRIVHDRDDPAPDDIQITCWSNQFEGFGGAVRTAIARCETEWLAVIMADGCDDVSALIPMQEMAERESLDIVIGSRFAAGGSLQGQSRLKAAFVYGAARLSRAMSDISDPSNNFRLYRVEALRRLNLTETTPALAIEILAQATHHGLRVGEVATQWQERRHQPSTRYLRHLPNYTKHFARYMLNVLRG